MSRQVQEGEKVALKHCQEKMLLGNKRAGNWSLLLSAAKHLAQLKKKIRKAGGGSGSGAGRELVLPIQAGGGPFEPPSSL